MYILIISFCQYELVITKIIIICAQKLVLYLLVNLNYSLKFNMKIKCGKYVLFINHVDVEYLYCAPNKKYI